MIDYEVSDRERDYACLVLRGDFVGDVSAERLKRELERHYVDDGVRTIKVSLGEVRTLSLDGVAILVELWRESRERGKAFIVEDATGQVREKLGSPACSRRCHQARRRPLGGRPRCRPEPPRRPRKGPGRSR